VIVRDGLKESNVVTKTFTVNDSGLPTNDDNDFSSDFGDTVHLENDYKPSMSKFGPQPALGSGRAKVFDIYYCYMKLSAHDIKFLLVQVNIYFENSHRVIIL